jgi:myo-inositol-1-phosphate synthase
MSTTTGVWLVGARGGIATCVAAGLSAIKRNLVGTEGLVTERPGFQDLGLIPLNDLVLGGHEIRATTLEDSAREYRKRTGLLAPELIDAVKKDLAAIDDRIKPGTALGCGPAIAGLDGVYGLLEKKLRPARVVERLTRDMRDFAESAKVDRLVVLNISSTEPYRKERPAFTKSLKAFERAIAAGSPGLSAGLLYAYAAMKAGAAYVNFTPTVASEVPALRELAEGLGLPHCGKDGKTGETLMKTALAPMFVERNFRVLSWEGYNMFGNRDAVVLDNPENNLAKTSGKDAALRGILKDDRTHTRVRIDYCPSLDDWKTAWDFIHFQGFLGTKMILQFIWQGCDSMLAAPLAIDLVRLADNALRRGEKGTMPHTAGFFKQPVDGATHDFFEQSRILMDYVRSRSQGQMA